MPHLRYTLRLLAKSPGFTITAILILGFGIGANTAIFSPIDAVILKPLPFPEPDRLVQISEPYQNQEFTPLAYPDYIDIAAAQRTLAAVAVVTGATFDLSLNGEPQHLQLDFISPSMFKVSGLPPLLGRLFTEQEDVPNGPFVALLSERCWKTRFHSDPSIIGKDIVLSENSFQVIGVVPAQPNDWGPPPAEVYAPIHTPVPLGMVATNRGYPLELRDVHSYGCIARLKPGISLAQAQLDLETLHNNLLVRYPDTTRGYALRVVPLLDSMLNDYAATTWLLGAAVVCLLLISCANVANLLFARGLQRLFLSGIGLYGVMAYSVGQRTRELAIRIALGAQVNNILRPVTDQGLKIVSIGLLLGIGSALVAGRLIEGLLYGVSAIDLLTIATAVLILGAAACLACLLPALRALRINPTSALRE